MSDTAVKTVALETGITSLAAVGDRLVKLAADGQLDDDREVIGDIATAMTNVRTEVAAVSRKLDVVQRDSQQRQYERDVARQQARDAEAGQKQVAADARTTMQLMVAGCVALCIFTGIATRLWSAPASVIADVELRAVVSAPSVPAGAVSPPIAGGAAAASSTREASVGTSAPTQATGDYACAFGYGRPPGQRCW